MCGKKLNKEIFCFDMFFKTHKANKEKKKEKSYSCE